RHNRLRHPRKMRELIDHASDVLDLTNNCICALLEDAMIFLDHFPILPAQPFGRELDRGQWILYLVGDSTGDIRPGRSSLRSNQFGNVVQSHDITSVGFARLLTGDPYRKIALATVAADCKLVLRACARLGCSHEIREFGQHFSEWSAESIGFG